MLPLTLFQADFFFTCSGDVFGGFTYSRVKHRDQTFKQGISNHKTQTPVVLSVIHMNMLGP
jgi:hypothetical protein